MFQVFCIILATAVLTLVVFGLGFVCGMRHMGQQTANQLSSLNARLGAMRDRYSGLSQ